MIKKRHYRRNRRKDSPEAVKTRRIERMARFFKGTAFVVSIFAMSALFIFGHDLMTQCDYFKAEKIVIEGAEALSVEEVMKQAGVHDEINVLAVNLRVARKKLLSHPWIEKAEVGRELPGTVFVRITEQDPLAVLDMGAKFVMNRRGEIFKAWEPSDSANLPEITGLSFSDMRSPGENGSLRFESVMEVLSMGLESNCVIPIGFIRKIDVDRHMGLSIHASAGEKVIRLGFENYPGKYSRLQRVIFHLKDQESFTDYNSIDLTNPDSIVVFPAKNDEKAEEIQKAVSRNKEA